MSLVDEYYESGEKPPREIEKKILFGVFNDLLGRKGFDNAWDDVDDEIREEIFQENLNIIKGNLL